MKLRIGYGLGTGTNLHDPSYGVVVDALERLGFDSLWLSEKVSGSAPDPLVAMAYGAGRTSPRGGRRGAHYVRRPAATGAGHIWAPGVATTRPRGRVLGCGRRGT